MAYADEAGWSGYPDARNQAIGDLWDSADAYGGEYAGGSFGSGRVYHVINAPNKLRLREGPGTQYGTITYMPNDAGVTVDEIQGGWAHVNYYGQIGWASTDYLAEGSGANVAPNDAPIPPYDPPPSPAPNLDPAPSPPPPSPAPPGPVAEAKKQPTVLYVLGAAAAAAAAYYLL